MRTRPTLIPLAVLALSTTASANTQPAGEPGLRALIVDERLREREVYVLAIEPDTLLLTDDSGEEWRREIRGLIAVLPTASVAEGNTTRSASGVLELTDGQRFPGSLLPTSSEGDAVRWVHEALGELAFTLDAVAGARLASGGPESFTADPNTVRIEDELLLTNGDVLRGFLAGLGDPVLFESDGVETSIPADRVSAASIANEPSAPEGVYLWLGDGTIARAGTLSTDPSRERLEFTIGDGQRAVYRVGALRGISFDASRLVPLATLTPSAQSPTGDRVFAEPIRFDVSSYDDADLGRATLGLANIEFPGPMEVRYELPANAARVGGTFVLDESTLPWGDCVVTVELDGRPLFSQRLSAESLEAPFSVTADGRELTLRIDPGNHGPILDRVSLKRAIVLLRD